MPDLTGFPAIDVAIGLAFLFFVLSTVSSALNEAVASLLGWRAKTLEQAISHLLGDKDLTGELGRRFLPTRLDTAKIEDQKQPVGAPNAAALPKHLTTAVLEHWAVRALVRDPESALRRRRRPSYLPASVFSLAVAEVVASGSESLKTGAGPWEAADERLFDAITEVLTRLPPGAAREAIKRAATDAGGKLDGFRINLETAFDDAMQRASGWYKRKTLAAIIVIAAALAFGLNVDTLKVGSRLWKDEPVRTAVTAQALNTLNQGKSGSGADPSATAPDPCAPLSGAQGSPPPPTDPIKCASKRAGEAGQVVEQVDQLGLPVGWGAGNAPNNWGWLLALPGWLITMFGISLGAPFWFDVLGKLARVRGSGPSSQPETTGSSAPASTERRSTTPGLRAWRDRGTTGAPTQGPKAAP
jgi:hypothetical protein